jgi:hypothetical protein
MSAPSRTYLRANHTPRSRSICMPEVDRFSTSCSAHCDTTGSVASHADVSESPGPRAPWRNNIDTDNSDEEAEKDAIAKHAE